MSKKFKLFCFGFGQTAKCFIKSLISQNYEFNLVVTTTSRTSLNEKIFNKNYKALFLNEKDYDKNIFSELSNSNKVLISIPPIFNDDLVLKNFGNEFKNNKFNWITYLSSTSVYGNKNGEWVDENSKTSPTSSTGIARLKAEKLWINLYKQHHIPLRIFRLAGIYSFERNVINRLKSNTAKIVEKKNHFFSRIHVEDIAQALIQSMELSNSGEVYNICDDHPCSNEEVMIYAANLIKVPLPPRVKLDELKNEKYKSFYTDSKKVRNTKMKENLKVKLNHPTYKEGLNNIYNNLPKF